MKLESANAHCPKCGSEKMYYLIGDNGYFQPTFQMKCINCDSYFTVAQVLGDGGVTSPPPKTNYEKIVEKTAEELAKWFCDWFGCPPERGYPDCAATPTEALCVGCWLDWLKQEAGDAQ